MPSSSSSLQATAEPVPARGPRLLAMLGRHQIASLISTAVDFGGMVLAVELLHLPPAIATLLGALCGALTNFQLGRRWVFEAEHGSAAPQALRYAVVSGGSAGLNALGEYAVHNVLGLQYMAARAIVAVLVSFCWNFPMQRHFVFQKTAAEPAKDRS